MIIQQIDMTFPGEGEMALLLALTDSGEVAGTLCVKRADPFVAEFARLFVRPEFRRAGYGRALVERAVEIAGAFGCCALSGAVHVTNRDARAFYVQLGFAIGFRFGDGDLLMTRRVASELSLRIEAELLATKGGAS